MIWWTLDAVMTHKAIIRMPSAFKGVSVALARSASHLRMSRGEAVRSSVSAGASAGPHRYGSKGCSGMVMVGSRPDAVLERIYAAPTQHQCNTQQHGKSFWSRFCLLLTAHTRRTQH